MTTPLRLLKKDFALIRTNDMVAIKKRFRGFIGELHGFLNNEVECLQDLQEIRSRWTGRKYRILFKNFVPNRQHWYTFNHGGRNEMQFNIGMYPDKLRIGMGFNSSRAKFGDPEAVEKARSCFADVIEEQRKRFEDFVRRDSLEIEGSSVATEQVVDRLLELLRDFDEDWVFVGRLLKPNTDKDKKILESTVALKKTIESIFCGFRPFWEQTQLRAKELGT